jgi:hypothetical protein
MKNILEKIIKILKSKKFLVILSFLVIIIFIFLVKDSLAGDALKYEDLTPEQQKRIMNQMSNMANPFSSLTSVVSGFFTSVLLKLPIAIASIIADVGGFLIEAEGKLLSWTIDIASFTKLGVVQQGWRICRDFANLFFIAILIYIAFAIILRLQRGDPKKLLFKIIVIAIIINFSLMIGGIIIDFSQVLFRYFIFAQLSDGNKDGIHFSEVLMNAVGVQNIRNTSVPLEATSVLIRLIFVILFTFLCVFVFGAIVVVLFIRNFWLWILLILSPLAWFFSIVPIPILSKYSGQWWENFIKWCFIAPIMGFFIFLSVGILGSNTSNISMEQLTKSVDKMEDYYDGKIDNSVISFSEKENSIFHPKMIIKFLVIISFLVAGLMAGQSLGLKAANSAIGMATKAGKNTQKWMGRKAMQTAPVRKAGNVLMGMGNIPIVGGVFKRAGMVTQGGVAKAKEEEMATVKKRMSYMTPEEMNKHAKTFNANEMIYAGKEEKFRENISLENWEKLQKIYSNKGMNNDVKKLEKEHPLFKADVRVDMTEFKTLTDILKASLSDLKSKQATLDGLPAGSPPATIAAATAARDAAKLQVNTDQTNHDAKRVIIENHLRNLDPEKISGAVKSTIFGDTNSIEFNALASVAATKPPQEGIEKIMKEMSKTKDGVTNMSTMVFKMAENVEGKTVTEKINKMRNLRILQRLNNNFLAAKLGFREPEINTHLASLYPV